MAVSRDAISQNFEIFSGPGPGLESWLAPFRPGVIFERLGRIEEAPLSQVQLNQLLVLSHEGAVSDGFFRYYWLAAPPDHPYDVTAVPLYDSAWTGQAEIRSLDQLYWGLYRLYVDALLWFGSVRTAYRYLRTLTGAELETFYGTKRFPTSHLRARGPALPLEPIARDARYLISEMACKSLDETAGSSELLAALLGALEEHLGRGGGATTLKALLTGESVQRNYSDRQQQLLFSADDILEETVSDRAELEAKYKRTADVFARARDAALKNTQYYLSMVNDLDVYVATSMRTRADFRSMAETCEQIFGDTRVREMNLRYFDPTLAAAAGHEDKGLIECLMVKCARVLVYCAGQRDSYGKDAEAAMALSLGKPVIFLCDSEQRTRFYRDVHPLSRLIDFNTGVPVGALVTDRPGDVAELLARIFENRMLYVLERPRPGYFRLREKLTNSVVRLQTDDALLRETFWNHYHESNRRPHPETGET